VPKSPTCLAINVSEIKHLPSNVET